MRSKSFRNGLVAAGALASIGLTGCAQIVGSLLDGAANAAGNRVGTAIGNKVGDAIVRGYQPQFMTYYTSYIFGLAFSTGGYQITTVAYKPGDYTRWKLPKQKGAEGQDGWIERSLLADDGKGNQWWKVKFFDGQANETTVLEGLFSADQGKLLRLRGQFPKDQKPQELPVDDQHYYAPPRPLSKESVAGATVGTESVTTPAGTFTARHVVFGQAGQGTNEWWLVDGVPGGVVKQAAKNSSTETASADESGLDANNVEMVLERYGSGAKSELGSL